MTGKVIQLLTLMGLLCCFSVLDSCLILLRFVSVLLSMLFCCLWSFWFLRLSSFWSLSCFCYWRLLSVLLPLTPSAMSMRANTFIYLFFVMCLLCLPPVFTCCFCLLSAHTCVPFPPVISLCSPVCLCSLTACCLCSLSLLFNYFGGLVHFSFHLFLLNKKCKKLSFSFHILLPMSAAGSTFVFILPETDICLHLHCNV